MLHLLSVRWRFDLDVSTAWYGALCASFVARFWARSNLVCKLLTFYAKTLSCPVTNVHHWINSHLPERHQPGLKIHR